MQLKYKSKNKNPAKGILFSVAVFIFSLLCEVCIITSLVMKGVSVDFSGILISQSVILISVFTGCFVSGKMINQKPYLLGLGTAGAAAITLTAIHSMIDPGPFENIPVTLGVIITGALLGAILSKKKRNKRLFFGDG